MISRWGRMQNTEIVFTFSGGFADQHVLDGSDAVRHTEAARQLLALHAHFFTTGAAPKGGALNTTKHYRVFKAGAQAACFVETWTVAIIGGALGSLLGEYGRRAIDYSFARFLQDSVRPVIRCEPSFMPPEMRRGIEPLPPADVRNSRVFDIDAEEDFRWRQLRERSTLTLPSVAHPVGRSADKLVITSGATKIGEIDVNVLRRLTHHAQAYREAAIADALAQLRLRQM